MFCSANTDINDSSCDAVETSTTCGRKATIFSTFGDWVSPTFAIVAVSAGKLQYVVIPTSRSPAPAANVISVRLGASETIRFTGTRMLTVRPMSSVTVRVTGPSGTGREPQPEKQKIAIASNPTHIRLFN